uniref:Bifunctional inhibitor/plant lipid transfer protein/seed storage helical domain-containing protein n=1 Tax=Aegilops tauschii subsp. strangulata TaxID=200361 RepID=A0A453CWV4_AEGTS
MGSAGATLVRFLLLASIVAGFAAHLAAGEKDCYDERDMIMSICIESIKKQGFYTPPTPDCRREVKKVDVPCICRVLTASDERTVSPVKLVILAHECHIELPVGSKCGAYTIGGRVPPPSAHA